MSVLAWLFVSSIHPVFWEFAASALVPVIVGGVLGGVTSSVIAPKHKVLVASLAGLSLSGALLMVLFRHDIVRFREPWIWYWPVWLIPSFAIGGYLSRRYWAAV
jgi:hypothetical protein